MLSARPRFDRLTRRQLVAGGGRGVLALLLLGPAVAACNLGAEPEPDPLESQLQAARSDSDLATAAAKAAPAALAPALAEVAAERGRHATALIEELARAAGKPTPTESPEQQTSATATAQPGPPAPPPTVAEVAAALRRSGESAAALVPTLSGYRAGLLGSIAAACATSAAIGLQRRVQPPGRPR